MADIKPGRYKHYKNHNEYQVTGFAHGVDGKERMVLYRPLYSIPELEAEYGKDIVFVRSCKIFTETMDVDGVETPRFQYIGG